MSGTVTRAQEVAASADAGASKATETSVGERKVLSPNWFKILAAPILEGTPRPSAPPPADKKAQPASATREEAPPACKPATTDADTFAVTKSEQLDKFQKVFDGATKLFGDEHTIISPLFYYSGDIEGRLQAGGKYQAGISATLLLPLLGFGGGRGADWWPVVTTDDGSKIYESFLKELKQYQDAVDNVQTVSEMKVDLQWKLDAHTLALAKQLICHEDLYPTGFKKEWIDALCGSSNDANAAADSKREAVKTTAEAIKTGVAPLVPKRHLLLLGPSLSIPLTKNPLNIFQYGAAVEVGRGDFRLIATGGLVGRYDRAGDDYKSVFVAGWYAGLALSGQIGDRLFHLFNGGSELLAQLAKAKNGQD
jgi:hypothetical protein